MKLSDKITKPWFVPGWIWNRGISLAAEKAKEEARIDKIAAMAGVGALDYLEKAVQGRDGAKVARVCANSKRAASLFARLAGALEDGAVSEEERAEVASALAEVVWGFVDQERIDAKIDEIAASLKV